MLTERVASAIERACAYPDSVRVVDDALETVQAMTQLKREFALGGRRTVKRARSLARKLNLTPAEVDVIGYVEPKPGIPPSPRHTIDLIQEMKRQNVKLILVEPYFDLKTPNSIARETGGRVVVLPPSVGGEKEITDYVKLFDYDLKLLLDAIKASGAR